MLVLNQQEQILCNLPVPIKTETYTPIPHLDFIRNIQESVTNKGMTITQKYYYSNLIGSQLVGMYKLSHEEADLALSIGFKNSYDKSMSAGFALGARVIVCGNGMVSGEYAYKRKHTGNVDFEMQQIIEHSLSMSQLKFDKLIESKNAMKSIILDQSVINSLVGELYFEKEVLRAEQLSLIKQLRVNPIHDHGVDPNSAWNIYNLCTYAVDKKSHPSLYINQHGELLSTFERRLGLDSSVDIKPVNFVTNFSNYELIDDSLNPS